MKLIPIIRQFAVFSVLLTGLASCEESDDIKPETLEVTPSETIELRAAGNEDVVLEIVTDAVSWDCSGPNWILAKKEGSVLIVNAKGNTSGGTRAGRLVITAGTAAPVQISVVQARPTAEDADVLNVEPAEPIEFESSANADATLTIDTNAPSWNYEASEWIIVNRMENTLLVNVEDNDTERARIGRLTVTAGTAEPVIITILQKKAGSDEPAPDAVIASLKAESGETELIRSIPVTKSIRLWYSLEKAIEESSNLEIYVDEAYLPEYNFIHKTTCQLFSPSRVTLANGGRITAEAGASTSGYIEVAFDASGSEFEFGVDYLLPLCVKTTSGNIAVKDETMRVNCILTKRNLREMKNLLLLEVNDVNPLNAIEYRLDDESYLFDVVGLFAANINYNASEDRVYLHNNPNVKALLDETDVYLQPLRERGIKVLLCVLGNHDAAGVAQLSDWGAKQFARELALAVKQYRLDGVLFDDEYSDKPDLNNKWFVSPSSAAGARLCYETKKAMKEECPWETDVAIYAYGNLGSFGRVDGVVPGEFVDYAVADYRVGKVNPMEGMTYKDCSGWCTSSTSAPATENDLRDIMSKGYGWLMFFNFNPVQSSNYYSFKGYFDLSARVVLGRTVLKPTGLYKKVGEGIYDPQRYDLPW